MTPPVPVRPVFTEVDLRVFTRMVVDDAQALAAADPRFTVDVRFTDAGPFSGLSATVGRELEVVVTLQGVTALVHTSVLVGEPPATPEFVALVAALTKRFRVITVGL